nr:alpha-methylacyl-CoA racemase-like isoform X6 [Cherax quadricarinatus]
MALHGIRVIEMAGLAPAPFCGMIMADFGASVIRVDKPRTPDIDRLGRGKHSIVLDVKKPEGRNIVKRICTNADVLIEPYRRGVMEKMGLGPEELMKTNPRLIYARLTGFGQSGPSADMAGHDINYVALSGLLSLLGRREGPPTPPINLLADFAGGGLMCALGIALALFERSKSGQGQVIDANMVEGAAYTGTWLYASRDLQIWGKSRGCNLLSFYQVFAGKDACVTPVLTLDEAPLHPHNAQRGSFIPSSTPGYFEPGPAPRFSRTPGTAGTAAPKCGQHTLEILAQLGYSKDEIEQLLLNEVAIVAKEKAHL